LSKPFVVTRNSDPKIISEFIDSRIDLFLDAYNLYNTFQDENGKTDGPGLVIKYKEINIF
jgi:hypothetical protein